MEFNMQKEVELSGVGQGFYVCSSGAVNEYIYSPKAPPFCCVRAQLVFFSSGVIEVFATYCFLCLFGSSFPSKTSVYTANTLVQPLIGYAGWVFSSESDIYVPLTVQCDR